jgi:SAM-dependent methyltransferase
MEKRNKAGVSEVAAPCYCESVAAIYRDDYAAIYPSLYIAPWHNKHDLNVKNLTTVFQNLVAPMPDWLDLACGQAWHFSMFRGRAQMVGVDLSAAQLVRAQARVPDAVFVHDDMASVSFPEASFDLITNFWAGYCYLGSQGRIADLLRKALRWIRTGGALYMEVLLARDLESFNRSHFAGQTGFAVMPRSEDYTDWEYDDVGGRHEMSSPPLEFFLDLLTPTFSAIEARHDSAFMVHLIATGKKPNP